MNANSKATTRKPKLQHENKSHNGSKAVTTEIKVATTRTRSYSTNATVEVKPSQQKQSNLCKEPQGMV